MFLIPWFGHLSDRFGRRPVYLFGAVGAAVWVFVFFALLDTGSFALIVLATVVALVFHAAMYGPQASFIAEMFPTRVRYTGRLDGLPAGRHPRRGAGADHLGGAAGPLRHLAGRVGVRRADAGRHDRLRPARAGDLAARPHGRPASHARARPAAWHDHREHRPQQRPRRGLRRSGPSATTRPCSSVVTSANVACGFHAGDPDILRRVCGLAAERGVVIGAQVGYRDLPGFGRRAMDVDPPTLTNEVIYQIAALDGFARRRRHPGQLRQAARGALQRRRAPRGAGRRRWSRRSACTTRRCR